jgi:hypothetical protein
MQLKDGRRQITARLLPATIDAIDARRAGTGLSRDQWIEKMATYCLSLPRIEPAERNEP